MWSLRSTAISVFSSFLKCNSSACFDQKLRAAAKECEPLFSRTNISTVDTTNPGAAPHKGRKRLITNDILESVPIIEEFTINEIFNGSPKKGFPGKKRSHLFTKMNEVELTQNLFCRSPSSDQGVFVKPGNQHRRSLRPHQVNQSSVLLKSSK